MVLPDTPNEESVLFDEVALATPHQASVRPETPRSLPGAQISPEAYGDDQGEGPGISDQAVSVPPERSRLVPSQSIGPNISGDGQGQCPADSSSVFPSLEVNARSAHLRQSVRDVASDELTEDPGAVKPAASVRKRHSWSLAPKTEGPARRATVDLSAPEALGPVAPLPKAPLLQPSDAASGGHVRDNRDLGTPVPACEEQYLAVGLVAARYGVAVPTIWRWAGEAWGFPTPIAMGPGTTRWRLTDLVAYEAGRGAANGQSRRSRRSVGQGKGEGAK